MDRPGDARGGLEWFLDQRKQRVRGLPLRDQIDRLAGRVKLDFLQSALNHVRNLILHDLDQVVQMAGFTHVVVNDEAAADRQGRGHGSLVQTRLNLPFSAPGFGVPGSTGRGDLADHAVTADPLLSLRGDARRQRFQPVEPGRDVVEEVRSEHLAAHDLVESAGDLLVHGDPRSSSKDAVGLLIREFASVVALELEALAEGDRPGTDDGRADWHERILAHSASA